MKHSILISALPLLCSSALLFGCPGTESETGTATEGDTEGDEDSDSDEDSDEDSDSVTLTGPDTLTTSETMTTDPDTTDTDPSETMTTDPDTTDTDPSETDPSSSSTDPSGTESETDPSSSSTDPTGEESTETGIIPMDNYNDCEVDDDCAKGEVCLAVMGNNVCGLFDCMDEGDCPAANSGDAVPACVPVSMQGDTACALDCSEGQDCPNGMVCAADFACAWPPTAPGGGMCPDDTIVGDAPTSYDGDSTDLFDDVIPSCGDGGGVEALLEFTTGEAGIYVFDTIGSSFDTVLFLQDGCDGDEIACNDDLLQGNPDSRLGLVLEANQTVIIGVDSYDGEVGGYTVNIEYGEGQDAGSCCVENEVGGCDNMEIESCVCDIDNFCCDTAWDPVCVGLVPVCFGLCG